MEKRKGKKGGKLGVYYDTPLGLTWGTKGQNRTFTPIKPAWLRESGRTKEADKRRTKEKKGGKKADKGRTKCDRNDKKNERGSLTWGTKDISCVFYVCGI